MLIHPSSFSSARLGPHHLLNIIGNPLDNQDGGEVRGTYWWVRKTKGPEQE